VTSDTHFSGGVYFDPLFKRLREVKSKWIVPDKSKKALEKSIVKGKNKKYAKS
jgi:hypothetical protein